MPRIIPEPRYFSMPSIDVGADVRMKRALNCCPWVWSLTHSPEAVVYQSGLRVSFVDLECVEINSRRLNASAFYATFLLSMLAGVDEICRRFGSRRAAVVL